MRIIGIGTDICEIKRIETMLKKHGESFIKKILTAQEIASKATITAHHLAKRFAAKEATAKALGCGIGENLAFHDMEIFNQENGKPFLKVKGKENLEFHLSISDEKHYAIAFVVVEKF